MSIVYYVSSHGFGHAARSVQVMQAISPEIALHVKSGVPEWFFWQEVHRPFTFTHDVFDCGTIELNGRGVDRIASLKTYASITERNTARLEDEVEWLKAIGARCVVTDIASFPLKAAVKVGIPGFLVANFTWVDIYEPYLAEYPRYAPLVAEMRGEYRLASRAFVAPPSVSMPYLHDVHPVQLMARRGRDRRAELATSFGLPPDRPLILCYPGNFGTFRWLTLGEMTEYAFFTFATVDKARPANVFTIDQGRFSHPDIVASVDAVVAKAGYGMVGECMANGKPMVYPDRDHFAEFQALDAALRQWGGALKIDQDRYHAGQWREALEQLPSLHPAAVEACNGARQVAEELERAVQS